MSRVKILGNTQMRITYANHLGLMYFRIGKKVIDLSYILTAIEKMRRCFPYLMWVSFWDCDSAKYYTGHKFFAWNYKDLNKKKTALNRYSDGTKFSEFKSLTQYIRS